MDSDAILKQFGLTFEELTTVERETFNSMLQSVQKNELTVDRLRDHITLMRDSVEQELSNPNIKLASNQDIFLKARLRNYMLLESFLISPQRAAEALKRQLQNVKKR